MPNKIIKKSDVKSKGHKSGLDSKSKEKQAIPNEDAKKRAAIAALSRLAQNSNSSIALNWALGGNSSEKNIAQSSKEHAQLAVEGVFFRCPQISNEILTKNQWKTKINDYLNEQMKTEKGITSCLKIHTLNCDEKKVAECVQTLCTYLGNILNYPNEQKYKKIRMSNRTFLYKVVPIKGAIDFLEAAGFRKVTLDTDEGQEEFLIYDNNLYDEKKIEKLMQALQRSKPIQLDIERNVTVMLPEDATIRIHLPDDFFTYTADDLKREQYLREKRHEENSLLRTKAMRETEEQRKMKKYRYALIRIRFPDNLFLQGTFGVYEKLKAIREFVSENLSTTGAFSLKTALGRVLPDTDDDKTLYELKLLPAVMLVFIWLDGTKPSEYFLKSSTLRNSQIIN